MTLKEHLLQKYHHESFKTLNEVVSLDENEIHERKQNSKFEMKKTKISRCKVNGVILSSYSLVADSKVFMKIMKRRSLSTEKMCSLLE